MSSVVDGGVPDEVTAERALRATLGAIRERLTPDEAGALAARLPEELGRVLDDGAYAGDLDADQLYRRVCQLEGNTALGMAKEHADIVLRALGDALDHDLCTRLVRALPAPMGEHLLAPDRGEPPPHVPARRAPPVSTLAHGRPGSRHPISEAAPVAGHTHSLARSDEPHADTKLSSGHGLEELHETLATGQPPGPARPISETSDD